MTGLSFSDLLIPDPGVRTGIGPAGASGSNPGPFETMVLIKCSLI